MRNHSTPRHTQNRPYHSQRSIRPGSELEDGLLPSKSEIPKLAWAVERKLMLESDRAAGHGTSGKARPTEIRTPGQRRRKKNDERQ